MVSIPLFVLLLATYAYSVPVGINDNASKPAIMNLVDDGATTQVPTFGRVTVPSVGNNLQVTTTGSVLNNERVTRGMMPSLEVELGERGIEESSTLFPTTVLPLNKERVPRQMMPSSHVELSARGIEESSTLFPTTVETSSQSVVRLPRGGKNGRPIPLEMQLRGIEESSTLFPTTVETSSQSVVRPPRGEQNGSPVPLEMQLRGIEESSTLFPSTVETSTQFNQRRIRGQNVQTGLDLQTTEEPTSSVSSFATTTGLLRPQRGEQTEEQESTPMTTDEATTEFSSTVQSNTVIEVIPGRNTKTEIIPGPNTKTEIISGSNTKTEIITRVPGRLVGGDQALSQGKDQPVDNKKKSDN